MKAVDSEAEGCTNSLYVCWFRFRWLTFRAAVDKYQQESRLRRWRWKVYTASDWQVDGYMLTCTVNARWYECVSAEVCSSVWSASSAIHQPWLCFNRALICTSYLDCDSGWVTALILHIILKYSYISTIHNDNAFLLSSPKQTHVIGFMVFKTDNSQFTTVTWRSFLDS